MNRSEKTVKLAKMAMLVAISVVLVFLIHFPVFPAAVWMEYDPADIPIFIGTFAFGPIAGFLITVVACAVQAFTVSSASGIIGFFMHLFATGSFVLVAGNIYKKHKTRKMAVIALVCGCLTMTVVMTLWNILLTPIFMGAPREAVMALLVPVIIPFNLLKSGINSVITFILYKSIAKFLHRS